MSRPLLPVQALAAALALLVTSCGASPRGPADTATRFLRELERSQLSQAMTRVLASVPRAALLDEALAIQRYGGIRTITTAHEKVRGDTASVVLEVTYRNGVRLAETFSLVRAERRWQIHSAALLVAATPRALRATAPPPRPWFPSVGPGGRPSLGGGIELTPPD